MFGKKEKSTKDLVHGGKSTAEVKTDKKPVAKQKQEKTEGTKKRARLDPKEILRSKYLWGGLSILAALLLTFVVVPMQQSRVATLEPVVVLAKNVAVGDRITADMLTTVEMSVGGIPSRAVMSTSEAVGLYVTTDGLAGDILTSDRLSPEYPTDDPFLVSLPEGKLAMAVSLSALEQNVASKLRAGDVIRLFAVLSDSASDGTQSLTAEAVQELQAVEILSITDNEALDIEDHGNTVTEVRQISTVVLAVSEKQAARLAALDSNATLYAALVSRGDPDRKAELLAEQERALSASVLFNVNHSTEQEETEE